MIKLGAVIHRRPLEHLNTDGDIDVHSSADRQAMSAKNRQISAPGADVIALSAIGAQS